MSDKEIPSEEDQSFYGGRGRGRGRGQGRGRGRGRGRPPVVYPIEIKREVTSTKGIIELTSFEMQILKLSDLENLNQNEIAEELDISQTSVWRYLNATRKKIAKAINEHHELKVVIKD